MLDSGAIQNLMSDRLAALLSLSPEATTKTISVAEGTAVKVHGTVGKVPVSFAGLKDQLDFLVVEGTPFDGIIGCPALEKVQACLDLGQQQVTITVNGKTVQLGFESDNSKFRALESGTDSEYFTSKESDDSAESDDEGFVVTVLDEPPYEPDLSPDSEEESDEDMPGLLELDDGYRFGYDSESGDAPTFATNTVHVEPRDSEIDEDCLEVTVGHGMSPPDGMEEAKFTHVMENSQCSADQVYQETEESLHAATLAAKLAHLPEDVQEEISSTLRDSGTVAWSLDDLHPADVPFTHSFELETEPPVHSRARRFPPRHATVVRQELDKMLGAGIITPSRSAWSFPVVIASKKDGKPRFCVDYRALNRVMKADRWPLHKIQEIFDDLSGSHFFSTLDLFSGYWQVRMDESCK